MFHEKFDGSLETTEKCPRSVGSHVDDLVGGGNLTVQKAVQWLRTELEFGTWEQSRFRFRGRELCQEDSRTYIKISMSKFVHDMEPVPVPKHVKDDLVAPLKANVHSQFRGGVGQLQWLHLQGNLSLATGILQSRSATPNGHDLLSHVIMAAHPDILRGESSIVSVLAWNSRKIRRVVRGSLGAECAAFSTDIFQVLYPSDRSLVRERLQEPGRCSPRCVRRCE